MNDNIVDMPVKEPPLLIGPFQEWRVVVDGRFVPGLTGRKDSDDTIWLTVDNRFAQPFSTREDAHSAAVLIAEATAIAHGYAHFSAPSKDRPFAPIAIGIS